MHLEGIVDSDGDSTLLVLAFYHHLEIGYRIFNRVIRKLYFVTFHLLLKVKIR
jgi:hypothetical protein